MRSLSPRTPAKNAIVKPQPESTRARAATQLSNRGSLEKIKIVGNKTTRLRKVVEIPSQSKEKRVSATSRNDDYSDGMTVTRKELKSTGRRLTNSRSKSRRKNDASLSSNSYRYFKLYLESATKKK